ncbi:hypothetical protein [Undibacterium sp. Xuan67W]
MVEVDFADGRSGDIAGAGGDRDAGGGGVFAVGHRGGNTHDRGGDGAGHA